MLRSFYQRHRETLSRLDGIVLKNPVLVSALVVSPVAVASVTLKQAAMVAFVFVPLTFLTLLCASFIPKKLPYTLRILSYALISCVLYIPLSLACRAMDAHTFYNIGVFLPLLTVNSLIVSRSETQFLRYSRSRMLGEVLCDCIGFTLVILLCGMIREAFGNNTLWDRPLHLPFQLDFLSYPFGGLIILGILAAAVQKLRVYLSVGKGA